MSDPSIGYAAVLEQFRPGEAVALPAPAEQQGFPGVMTAHHLGERTTGGFGRDVLPKPHR